MTRRLRADPSVDRVLVVSYMVADGILRDRMVDQAAAAGAELVPGTLADTDALAELILRRAQEAMVCRALRNADQARSGWLANT